MQTRKLVLTAIVVFGLIATGCTSKSDLLEEISGQWQDEQGNQTIEIKLAGDITDLKVNGHDYSVTVDKVEMDRYQVNLKVQNGSGETELWTLRQIWADNGADFKLAFDHSGEKDILVPKTSS